MIGSHHTRSVAMRVAEDGDNTPSKVDARVNTPAQVGARVNTPAQYGARDNTPAQSGLRRDDLSREAREQIPNTPDELRWMGTTSAPSTPSDSGIMRMNPDTKEIEAMSKTEAQVFAVKATSLMRVSTAELKDLQQKFEDQSMVNGQLRESSVGMKELQKKFDDQLMINERMQQEVEFANSMSQSFVDAASEKKQEKVTDSAMQVTPYRDLGARTPYREGPFRDGYDDRAERFQAYEKKESLRKAVPDYKGDETVSIISYLKQFGIIRAPLGWTDQLAGYHLVRALTGKAVQVLRDLPDENQGYDTVSKALIAKFEPATQVEAYRNQFEYRMRDSRKENPHQYAEVLRTLASKAFSFMSAPTKEYLVQKQFEKGQTLEVRRMLAGNPDLGTVDRCVAMVSKFEACMVNDSMRRVGTKPTENLHLPTVNVMEEMADSSIAPLENEGLGEYETNYAAAKFNSPRSANANQRQGDSKYRPAEKRGAEKEIQESIRRIEMALEMMQKGIERNQLAINASGYPSSPLSTVASTGSCSMINVDAPTIYDLMVLMGADASSVCWFCKDKGHRYMNCDLFHQWMKAKKDLEKGALPPMPNGQPKSKLN